MIQLTSKQYTAVIILGFLFLGIMGTLVWKLITNQVEFDYTCPVPKDEIKFCECLRNANDDTLRICTCYPGDKTIKPLDIINFSEVKNGTTGSS